MMMMTMMITMTILADVVAAGKINTGEVVV